MTLPRKRHMKTVEYLRKQLKEKYCLCLGDLTLKTLAHNISRTDKSRLKAAGRSYKTGNRKTVAIYVKDLLAPRGRVMRKEAA